MTVTRVGADPRPAHAHVYVGVLGDQAQRNKTLAGLKQAAGFIRRELGQRVRMRHTPELVFHYDEGPRRHRPGGAAPGREPAAGPKARPDGEDDPDETS